MSAEVDTMVSVKEMPWHKNSFIADHQLTREEAEVQGGIDWRVIKEPVFMQLPAVVEGELGYSYAEVPGAFLTRRDDKPGLEGVLGYVGSQYTVLQNDAAFKLADDIVGGGGAFYETAGSLYGGKRVWMLLQMPGYIEVTEGDPIKKYLALTNGHDGCWGLRAFTTDVRIVCRNTLRFAIQGTKNSWYIKHTANILHRADEARRALSLAVNYHKQFEEIGKALAQIPFMDSDMMEYATALTPINKEQGQRAEDARMAERQTMMDLFQGPTCDLPGMAGTAWAGLQAATEWADWRRLPGEDTADRRQAYQWFGGGAERKQKALCVLGEKVGMDLAAGN